MKLVVEDGLSLGWVIHSFQPGRLSACLVVKGVYQLQPGNPALPIPEALLLSGDRYQEEEPVGSLRYASDFVPRKARAEVLVTGTAQAPGGKPVDRFAVRASVGEWSKELAILGPRTWQRTGILGRASPSAAESLVSLPLQYESAWGGPDSPQNPVGCGRQGDRMPQIELLQRPVQNPKDDLPPAGFGPLPSHWQPRSALVGKYDERWRKERWPWLPEDFDFGFFNAAPRDQQVDQPWQGNEVFQFENMHPRHAVYRGRLPGVRARCFVREQIPGRERRFREVPLVLETLVFDLDTEQLILLWRGAATVRDLKLRDVENILAWTEPLSGPEKTLQDYHNLLKAQLAPEPEEEETPDEAPDMRSFEAEFATMDQEFAAAEQQLAAHEKQALAWGNQEWQKQVAAGTAPGPAPAALLSTGAIAAPPTWDEFLAANPGMPAEYAASLRADWAQLIQLEDEFATMDAEMEALFPLPLTRADVEAAAAQKRPLPEAELRKLDLSGLDLSGMDLRGADLSGCNLANTLLTGAMLSEASLVGCDLSGADLTGAVLDGADVSKAKLAGARLTKLSLAGATLAKLDLVQADLSGSRGELADFSGSNLTGAKLSAGRWSRADFTAAKLDQADFAGSVLSRASLNGVSAVRARFEQADLSGASLSEGADFTNATFSRAKGVGAIFTGAILNQARFEQVRMPQAQFGEASLPETLFDRSDLSGALFEDALLHKAQLTNCNLLRASFERANLTRTDLSGSNLYEAGFWEAVLEETNLDAANLKGTNLS